MPSRIGGGAACNPQLTGSLLMVSWAATVAPSRTEARRAAAAPPVAVVVCSV